MLIIEVMDGSHLVLMFFFFGSIPVFFMICECVCRQTREVVSGIKKRLTSRTSKVQLLALTVSVRYFTFMFFFFKFIYAKINIFLGLLLL